MLMRHYLIKYVLFAYISKPSIWPQINTLNVCFGCFLSTSLKEDKAKQNIPKYKNWPVHEKCFHLAVYYINICIEHKLNYYVSCNDFPTKYLMLLQKLKSKTPIAFWELRYKQTPPVSIPVWPEGVLHGWRRVEIKHSLRVSLHI